MWIICCGMKRSGSTLQYQIAAHLVEMTGKGTRVGWADTFEEVQAQHPDNTSNPRWKVYKNHNYSASMGAALTDGRAKGIYMYRDLRDVFVSFMHKQNASFERLWTRDILRELVENYAQWTQQPNVLVSRYETMMADVSGEVSRIAAHLGLTITPEEAKQIAAEYSVTKQLERIEQADNLQVSRQTKGVGFDRHTLLHENHISEEQGQVGQWKTALTPEQVSLIENRYGAWMKANGYLE